MDPTITALINTGVAGMVLAWFMLRLTPAIIAMRASIDRMTRASMLELVTRENVAPAVRDAAQRIIDECDMSRSIR